MCLSVSVPMLVSPVGAAAAQSCLCAGPEKGWWHTPWKPPPYSCYTSYRSPSGTASSVGDQREVEDAVGTILYTNIVVYQVSNIVYQVVSIEVCGCYAQIYVCLVYVFIPCVYREAVCWCMCLTLSLTPALTVCPLRSSLPFPCQVTSAVSSSLLPKITQAWSSDRARWTSRSPRTWQAATTAKATPELSSFVPVQNNTSFCFVIVLPSMFEHKRVLSFSWSGHVCSS